MRTIIDGTDMSNKYWSATLTHCVYLNNILPQKVINTTPFEAYTCVRLDISHLKVFGSHITSRKPGERATKLAKNVSHGVFLVIL